MKILLVHSDPLLPARQSIDLWRIIRPFNELAKHVDWQIDHKSYLINQELYNEKSQVETDKLLEEIEKLKDYDIIWTSYFPDAVLFDVLLFMHQKYGTKIVLDVDDDMYHIPTHNNIWKSAGISGVKALQYMIEEAPYLVTSSENLRTEYEKHRKSPTYLLPNFIGDDYKHPPFDNGEDVVIGYFGSVTHKKDITETGFLDALQQIMHKYKNVRVQTVGMSIDAYLPKQRYTHKIGLPGQAWIDTVWPSINCDIAVAPLEDTAFNRSKTNIKWLETSMIPAAFIGSNVEPYKGTVEPGKTGLLTDNSTEGWYEALEKLVTDATLRKQLATNVQKEINTNWNIKQKWQTLKEIVESIYEDTDHRDI